MFESTTNNKARRGRRALPIVYGGHDVPTEPLRITEMIRNLNADRDRLQAEVQRLTAALSGVANHIYASLDPYLDYENGEKTAEEAARGMVDYLLNLQSHNVLAPLLWPEQAAPPSEAD